MLLAAQNLPETGSFGTPQPPVALRIMSIRYGVERTSDRYPEEAAVLVTAVMMHCGDLT